MMQLRQIRNLRGCNEFKGNKFFTSRLSFYTCIPGAKKHFLLPVTILR